MLGKSFANIFFNTFSFLVLVSLFFFSLSHSNAIVPTLAWCDGGVGEYTLIFLLTIKYEEGNRLPISPHSLFVRVHGNVTHPCVTLFTRSLGLRYAVVYETTTTTTSIQPLNTVH